MTHEPDVERLLDTWLSEGPSATPARVIDAVADRISHQHQRSAWRFTWRYTPMHAYIKPLAALAAVVVLAVAAFTLLRPSSNVASPSATSVQTPTAIPATASPSTSAAVVCLDETVGCAGPLAAGDHSSSTFAVPFRYTVPEGWVNDRDIARTYALSTTAGLAAPIEVFSMVALADQAACGPVPLAGAGSTVQALIDFVETHPGLDASAAVPVTIDGYRGQAVDFSVRPDWTAMCPNIDSTTPVVMTLTDTGTPPGRQISYTVDNRVRWTVLDVAGETVVVEVSGPPVLSQFAATIAQDQPIVDSLDFSPGG